MYYWEDSRLTHQDESAASRPWWDGRKDRSEKEGNEEAYAGSHSSQASPTTFSNPSTRLDERSYR